MDERVAHYQVQRDGASVGTFPTAGDTSAEREAARELALACAERAARQGGHVTVVFLLPYRDEWLGAPVWDSLKEDVAAAAQPYHRQRLSPLASRAERQADAASSVSSAPHPQAPSDEGLTPGLD